MEDLENCWIPVKDYEDYYEINGCGIVRSKRKRNFGYIMEQRLDRGGYNTVRLAKPGKQSCTVYVHRLLSLAFFDNTNNEPCINHIDGNKLNNNLENLEWISYSGNMKHAFKTGLISYPFSKREIIDDRTSQVFYSLKDAAIYNFYEYSKFKNLMKVNSFNPTSLRYRDASPTRIKTIYKSDLNFTIFDWQCKAANLHFLVA